MRYAVVGTRAFYDYSRVCMWLDFIFEGSYIEEVITGSAEGTDELVRKYCEDRKVQCKEIKPNTDAYGKSAPLMRQREIVDGADRLIAFWDGKSGGTGFTIAYAAQKGKVVQVIGVKSDGSKKAVSSGKEGSEAEPIESDAQGAAAVAQELQGRPRKRGAIKRTR